MHRQNIQVTQSNQGQLDVVIKAKSADVDTSIVAAKLTIGMGVFTAINSSGLVASDLISADQDNHLKLGSDNKLLAQHADVDFMAYFLLAKG